MLKSTASGLQLYKWNSISIETTFAVYMVNLPSIEEIWSVSEHNFNDIALQIFHYQVKNNQVYAQYINLIDQNPSDVRHFSEIPFLPITFFKTHDVVCGKFKAETIFESSSTTGQGVSKNMIKNLELYHQNCLKIIESKIGAIGDYEIFGLLPNYLERKHSSLVSMIQYLMHYNNQTKGFYLYNHDELKASMEASEKKILLFGVSFALLDFADEHTFSKELTVIETGGMKGRKKELTKAEVYAELNAAFSKGHIVSEYGMTELLSQAYSDTSGIYTCPRWMKVLPRADNDPLSNTANGHTAALNIIDLANLHSCCFIATDDLGKIHNNGQFEVLGRLDYADIRGCSLMI